MKESLSGLVKFMGFKSVVELSEISGVPVSTFKGWHKSDDVDKHKLLVCVMEGAGTIKRFGGELKMNRVS